jgi:hypothetical protein
VVPARQTTTNLHSLAELVSLELILGFLKSLKIRALICVSMFNDDIFVTIFLGYFYSMHKAFYFPRACCNFCHAAIVSSGFFAKASEHCLWQFLL